MPDNLTPAQRSYCMSRVKGKDTSIEQAVRRGLHKRGLRFRKHRPELPGKPDVVFLRERVVIFVDGDFWHGFRFPKWKHKLTGSWRAKIERTRERDLRNFRRLRRDGWVVLRVWEHQVKRDLPGLIEMIERTVLERRLDT